MPKQAIELSREARRIYRIALEVAGRNPARAERLKSRALREARTALKLCGR